MSNLNSKQQEFMERAGIVCEDMVISDMLKDMDPKDTQDQIDVGVTIEYRECNGVDNLVTKWLTGDRSVGRHN